jgi:GDP-4-dehydro-6-deoxy-D-mannose reductase
MGDQPTRLLITGASGFVGQHLIPLLTKAWPTCHLHLAGREQSSLNLNKVDLERIHHFDLRDAESVRRVVRETSPDAVIHLAGISVVHNSWKKAATCYEINTLGSIYMIEALAEQSHSCKFIYVSTGDLNTPANGSESGQKSEGNSKLPHPESLAPEPRSPYTGSKLAAEVAIQQLCRNYPHVKPVLLRPYAHTGPGQTSNFVCSAFAQQIAEIEGGLRDPVMEVGNLESRRDFTDVRDICEAYKLAVESAPTGVPLNISSGESHSIQSLLDFLLSQTETDIQVVQKAERLRPWDPPVVCGDSTKFRTATGWHPTRSIQKTLVELLNWWRNDVRSSTATPANS